MKNLAKALAVGAVAAGAAMAFAVPASAVPVITHLNCTAGGSLVLCDVTHAGTPVSDHLPTIRWWINDVGVFSANNEVTMTSTCRTGDVVRVKVTVSDDTGSATRTTSTICLRFQP